MVHLAYSLGLRPVEISRITLDDISFKKAEITLRDRKGNNPVTLPIAEKTMKAIAAYVLKARPKSLSRHLFLTFSLPITGPYSASHRDPLHLKGHEKSRASFLILLAQAYLCTESFGNRPVHL